MSFFSNHFVTLLPSFCMFRSRDFGSLHDVERVLSSAKIIIFDEFLSVSLLPILELLFSLFALFSLNGSVFKIKGSSLMKMKKIKGPKIEPCGTPHKTGKNH